MPIEMLEVPVTELSAEALTGVIDAFVLREGTDYGHIDYSLEEKRESVLQALQSGRARILFDPESGHIEIELIDQR